jgi:hypothetical protein
LFNFLLVQTKFVNVVWTIMLKVIYYLFPG